MEENRDNIAFARKYRPKNIDEYLGNHVKQILKNRFSDPKNFPQTILLYGTRGTGKTSAARIIAKEYHCLDRVDGHACGHCEMCQELDERLISSEAGVIATGVQEVDIASESGKANIDSILEDALIEPMYPLKYKVLILDEFHMATKQAQNRLLKIFEEPPKHLVFILCTTNPENIIETITSRCQLKIEVKKADVEELANRLLEVCKYEKIKTSIEALKRVVKLSDRVPRESLMLLESIAKNYGNEVTIETIQKQTGDISSRLYIDYYEAANNSLEAIVGFSKKLKEMDVSVKSFISGLTRFTIDALYIKYAIGIEDFSHDYVKAIKKLFKIYTSKELDTLLQIIEYANKGIDSDDTKAELILITTAMRIGKVGLLSIGLANQDVQAIKENKVSMAEYKKILKSDAEDSRKVSLDPLSDASLISVFGKNTEGIGKEIISVTEGISLDSKEKEGEEDNRMLSDDELLEMFKEFA